MEEKKEPGKLKKSMIFCVIVLLFFYRYKESFGIDGDLNGHRFGESMAELKDKDIFSGYEDGNFRPDNPITLAEFATVINRLFGFEVEKETGKWYEGQILAAERFGYFGDIDLSEPERPMSREEVLWIIADLFYVEEKVLDYEGGENISRGEAADIILSAAGRIQRGGVIENSLLEGNLVLASGKTELKNIEIRGNLYLMPGLKEEALLMSGVKVEGKIYIMGGGELSFMDCHARYAQTGLYENKQIRLILENTYFDRLITGSPADISLDERSVVSDGWRSLEMGLVTENTELPPVSFYEMITDNSGEERGLYRSPTPSSTPTTPRPTSMPSPIPTPKPTPTPTPPPSPTPGPPPSPTPTAAPSPIPSLTPTATPSPSPSPTPTATPSPSPSPTPTATPSPSPTPTATPSPSPTPTAMPSPSPSSTPTATPTPSASPTPTATPTPSPTPTATPTPTPSASPTPTPTPTPDKPPAEIALEEINEAGEGEIINKLQANYTHLEIDMAVYENLSRLPYDNNKRPLQECFVLDFLKQRNAGFASLQEFKEGWKILEKAYMVKYPEVQLSMPPSITTAFNKQGISYAVTEHEPITVKIFIDCEDENKKGYYINNSSLFDLIGTGGFPLTGSLDFSEETGKTLYLFVNSEYINFKDLSSTDYKMIFAIDLGEKQPDGYKIPNNRQNLYVAWNEVEVSVSGIYSFGIEFITE